MSRNTSVSLGDHFAEFVDSQVRSGRYGSASDVVMEALARGDKIGRVCTVRDEYFRYAAGSHVGFYRETAYTLDVIRVLHQLARSRSGCRAQYQIIGGTPTVSTSSRI